MELELKHACLDAYETGGELTLTQEESAETIVPDYCPDMARIIASHGKTYIHSRDLQDGKARVAGTVRVTVLYVPEGENGIRALNFAMPFTVEHDGRTFTGCQMLTAEITADVLESRMLNPRKMFTHCTLAVRLTGYRHAPLCFCTDIEGEKRLETRREQQKAILLTGIFEKDFTFSEDLNLSPGRAGAAELLFFDVRNTVTEVKSVGNKLIFKGIFSVSVLYRSVEGRFCSTVGELPFSQIMEAEGGEGSIPTLQMQMTGAELQISGDDPEGRQIGVTLYIHAVALLRQEQEVTLLSDLYSTSCEAAFEASPLTLTAFHDFKTRRQTVREVLEIGAAERVLSLSAECGRVSVSHEGMLRTSVTVRALCLDRDGNPLTAERTVDVACQTDLPEDCRICAVADCGEEVQGSLGDRGIEVRFPVDFRIELVGSVKRVCVTAAKLNEEKVEDAAERPSLVLRCLGSRESVWELAKQYRTTISAILSANQLESEAEIPRDRLLLIPRKRA